VTDTPAEREGIAPGQAAPPQGGAVGRRLRRGAWDCCRASRTSADIRLAEQIQQFSTLALLIGLPII